MVLVSEHYTPDGKNVCQRIIRDYKIQEVPIKIAKVRENAIIPTKRDEDAGYDIYTCFEEGQHMMFIFEGETVMIPCGIATSFSSEYAIILKERGSTGTIGIAQRSGVIDSGFRGEWRCPITNLSGYPIVIYDDKLLGDDIHDVKDITIKTIKDLLYDVENADDKIAEIRESLSEETFDSYTSNWVFWPASKAICQAILIPVIKAGFEEVSFGDILADKSERLTGKLGSSGK